MATVGVQRTLDGVLTSADSTTIQINDHAGSVIVVPVVVPPTSPGVYNYDTAFLAAGDYTVTWTFVVSGFQDDVITRTFTIDPPVAVTRGVTLADIERAIARRVGPYWRYPADSGSGLDKLAIRKLRSSLDLGDYEELWMLRRGRTMTNALVASFDSNDRQRLIATYTPALGALVPDRDWLVPAVTNESIELHYLDPEQELREIARDGLRRCFFWDTAEITNVTTTLIREINVSASMPWITQPKQIRNVEFGRTNQMATRLSWWKAIQIGADVYLRVSGLPIGNLRITALRPHFTFVNGEMSYGGPDDDNDVLHVNLEYAARAGHIAAWASVPDRLTPVAAEGLRLPMKLVAAAFTAASFAEVRNEPELLQIPFGQDARYLDQVGNA